MNYDDNIDQDSLFQIEYMSNGELGRFFDKLFEDFKYSNDNSGLSMTVLDFATIELIKRLKDKFKDF